MLWIPTFNVRPNADPVTDIGLLKAAHWVARLGGFEDDDGLWIVSAPGRSVALRTPEMRQKRTVALVETNKRQGFPGIEWAFWSADEAWHVLIAANGDIEGHRGELMISLIVGDEMRLQRDLAHLSKLQRDAEEAQSRG